MDKRTFIKTSSSLVLGGALTSMLGCNTSNPTTENPDALMEPLNNWAGNLTYSTKNVYFPKDSSEIPDLVKKLKIAKGLGSQHSFSTVADSKHAQVSLRNLRKLIQIDSDKKEATVEGGARYGDICEALHKNGFGLQNLASLPHISIAGACATATHGSGVNNPALAADVKAIDLVKANGELVQLSREKDADLFNGAIVSLGALGIITKLTLDLRPTYEMQQVVYRNMPMAALESDFDTIMSSGYSVSFFTDWRNKNINEVWIKSRLDAANIVSGEEYYGGTLAKTHLHPVESLSPESCSEQMGIPGPWFARLPHFKMGFTPSSGEELQAEFFVPYENAYEAIMAVESLNEAISPHLYITEIRSIAADDFWMSPFYKKKCIAIHFTFKPEPEAVSKLVPQIEAALDPYGVRPHWGKLSALAPKVLQSRITRLNDFKELMQNFDPEGKFRNAYINEKLFG